MRKTIEVETVREWVNKRLEFSDSVMTHLDSLTPQQAFRLGVVSLLEQVLFATDNYNGFMYRSGGGDETRRYYYGSTK